MYKHNLKQAKTFMLCKQFQRLKRAWKFINVPSWPRKKKERKNICLFSALNGDPIITDVNETMWRRRIWKLNFYRPSYCVQHKVFNKFSSKSKWQENIVSLEILTLGLCRAQQLKQEKFLFFFFRQKKNHKIINMENCSVHS